MKKIKKALLSIITSGLLITPIVGSTILMASCSDNSSKNYFNLQTEDKLTEFNQSETKNQTIQLVIDTNVEYEEKNVEIKWSDDDNNAIQQPSQITFDENDLIFLFLSIGNSSAIDEVYNCQINVTLMSNEANSLEDNQLSASLDLTFTPLKVRNMKFYLSNGSESEELTDGKVIQQELSTNPSNSQKDYQITTSVPTKNNENLQYSIELYDSVGNQVWEVSPENTIYQFSCFTAFFIASSNDNNLFMQIIATENRFFVDETFRMNIEVTYKDNENDVTYVGEINDLLFILDNAIEITNMESIYETIYPIQNSETFLTLNIGNININSLLNIFDTTQSSDFTFSIECHYWESDKELEENYNAFNVTINGTNVPMTIEDGDALFRINDIRSIYNSTIQFKLMTSPELIWKYYNIFEIIVCLKADERSIILNYFNIFHP